MFSPRKQEWHVEEPSITLTIPQSFYPDEAR